MGIKTPVYRSGEGYLCDADDIILAAFAYATPAERDHVITAINEHAALKAKLAVAVEVNQQLRCALECAANGLLYAEPVLSQLHGIKERFDKEMQEHLHEAVLQVRRSQNDVRKILALAKIKEAQ